MWNCNHSAEVENGQEVVSVLLVAMQDLCDVSSRGS